MRVRLFSLTLSLALALTGCASNPNRGKTGKSSPTTKPSPQASLHLEQITPAVVLSETTPATQPTGRPPVEALMLYAEATEALQTGRRFTAISLLQKAIELDPNSFELNYALGRAQVIGRTHDEASIAAFVKAASLRPDHLDLQTDLGRQFLAKEDYANALRHLRLAVQTTGYREDDSASPIADLFLARALQHTGYDLAALEQYAKLLRRVQGASMRNDPHLAFLITDRLYVDIGDLYARNGQFEDALSAYNAVAKRDPTDSDVETRVVRSLIGLGRWDEASHRAAEAVVRLRASPASMELLREVHRAKGGEANGTANALAAMYKQRPGDVTVLFALIAVLREDNRWKQADDLLARHFERSPDDIIVLRQRVQLRVQRDDLEGAARLLISTAANRPEIASDIGSFWQDVITPARAKHLKLRDVQALEVPPAQLAAKEYSVAVVADALRRNGVAETAIARAVTLKPPLAPAFRKRIAEIWLNPGFSEEQRSTLADELVTLAAAGGSRDATLPQEIRGLSFFYRKQFTDAAGVLGKLADAKDASPAVIQAHAVALRGAGDKVKFEQLMWKLLSDHPSFEDGYSTLYAHYDDAKADGPADRVLNTWEVAIPYSTSARILRSVRQFQSGKTELAEQAIVKLIQDSPGDTNVLRTAQAFFSRGDRGSELAALLEKQITGEPGNVAALAVLVDLYEAKGKSAVALPLLEAARKSLTDDPDHLYLLSHLYARIERREQSETVLQQALQAEPAHPPASNDLGYSWAERGERLPEAESLIRQAVNAEPENHSYLDSLGWVLYKQEKFAEARVHLEKAASEQTSPDPIVLDHLGDVLYRLGDKPAAAKQWELAIARLAKAEGELRDDLKVLKTSLEQKTGQLKANEPVTVSPVVEEAKQAKK